MSKKSKRKFEIQISDFDNIKKTVDKINHGGNKPFTLSFENKKIHQPVGSKATICELDVRMKWNIPSELLCTYMVTYNNVCFHVKAVAICCDEDVFDASKGVVIATTRAENAAYAEGYRRLELLCKEFERLKIACENAIQDLSCYYYHNNMFLDEVFEEIQTKTIEHNNKEKTDK